MAKIVQTVYPSPIPAIAAIKRAALSTASTLNTIGKRLGELVQFSLQRSDGLVLWTSPVIRVSELPVDFQIPVPHVRFGYTVWFTYIDNTNKPHVGYQDRRHYPFYFKKKKRKNGLPPSVLILIKGKGSPDLRDTLRLSRIRSRRDYIPKLKREWRPLFPERNGKLLTQSFPTWSYTNGSGSSSSASKVSYQRSWGGVVTPNFLIKKKQGKLPINSYNMTLEKTNDGGYVIDTWFSDGTGSYSTQGGPHQNQWGTSEFGTSPAALPTNTSVDFRAQRKLREKVGPSNNLAQDFWQIGQTVDLISDSAKRIAASIHNLRSGNLAGAVSHLWHSREPRYHRGHHPNAEKSLADNWLALQYGWKPLLQDIDGAMDSLARLNLGSVVVYTARSSAHYEEVKQTDLFLNVTGRPKCGVQTQVSTIDIRYGIRYQIDNHLKTFLAQTGFTNPINLAWELLPYSFVVDWFIPIGPYLESLSAWDGLSFIDGWKSSLTQAVTIWATGYSGSMFPNDPTNKQMCSYLGNCVRTTVSYARTKLSSFPTSPVPTFKNPITGHHALNALALMKTAFYPGGR